MVTETSDRPTKRSVLIVDDDEDICRAFEALLRSESYEVATCPNGLAAMEALESGANPDVILLDLMMPVMDGWQFRVRQKRDPSLSSIPVVAVTGDRSSKAAAIDADAYLTKPVDAQVLLATIERLLLARDRARMQAQMIETGRLASLGTLAAGVAHEINNPLTYVMANVDLVRRSLENLEDGEASSIATSDLRVRTGEPLTHLLQQASDGLQRIRTIVRDLRTFSKPVETTGRPLDVLTLLDSCANMVRIQVQHRARLVKHYEPVPLIHGSEGRLAQVFLNLIVNAAEAISEGDPETNEIRITAKTSPSGGLVVEVCDTGEGIAEEDVGRIFEPFFTTKPMAGTGLGLSICHGIVSGLGGKLSLDTQKGKGSTFRVELPASLNATETKALGDGSRRS